MAKKTDQKSGIRRPRLDIPAERLFLDPENPRLPEDIQGKKESELLNALYKGFNLDEI